MVLLRQVYASLFRRSSTFALSIVLGAVLFERAFDQGADALFEQLNEGVKSLESPCVPQIQYRTPSPPSQKLWKHIKHKYEN